MQIEKVEVVRTIPLTQGKVALVDECDYEYLMQWKWQFAQAKHQRSGYVVHSQKVGLGRWCKLQMHRVVAARIGLVIGNQQIDHVDGDGLNNCRNNLRVASQSQNRANLRQYQNNTSGFKGVVWDRCRRKWVAKLQVAGRDYNCGGFENPRDAARAYNEAALKHFGEFAKLNFV